MVFIRGIKLPPRNWSVIPRASPSTHAHKASPAVFRSSGSDPALVIFEAGGECSEPASWPPALLPILGASGRFVSHQRRRKSFSARVLLLHHLLPPPPTSSVSIRADITGTQVGVRRLAPPVPMLRPHCKHVSLLDVPSLARRATHPATAGCRAGCVVESRAVGRPPPRHGGFTARTAGGNRPLPPIAM